MSDEHSGVKRTAVRVKDTLKKLLTEGRKVSQHAVEKEAGLANGALNYNCPEYRELRESIRRHKAQQQLSMKGGDQGEKDTERLKEKYRQQRNQLRDEIKTLMAENVELVHNLILMQQYICELEKSSGLERGRVMYFPSELKEK